MGKRIDDPERHIFATILYWAYYDRILSSEEIRFASINPVKTFELRDFPYAKAPIINLVKIVNETLGVRDDNFRYGAITRIISEILGIDEARAHVLALELRDAYIRNMMPIKIIEMLGPEKTIEFLEAIIRVQSLQEKTSIYNLSDKKKVEPVQ